jgi:Zn-dependent metalloprotease
MLTPLSPIDDRIQIRNFQFRCIYSLYQNVIVPSQEISANLMQTLSECYDNNRIVLDFLKTRLEYNGLDNNGRALIVNINCDDCCEYSGYLNRRKCQFSDISVRSCALPRPSCDFINAYFVPYGINEFMYGQKLIEGSDSWESIATCLTIVAHEIFHAVTYFSCNLIYNRFSMSGALHESYSDIFAVLVYNRNNPDIDTWIWSVGNPFFCDIRNLDTEQHMWTYNENRSAYHNMGIHSYAAYKIITARDTNTGEYLFKNITEELPKLFYNGLPGFGKYGDKIERSFTDSRNSIAKAARVCFRNYTNVNAIIYAIEDAFDFVGIPARNDDNLQ